MLLHTIGTNRKKYQYRERAFSEQTVAGIVEEGVKPAKFDPIPVIQDGEGWVVAGDGHSRLEACRRLAEEDRLPEQWRRPDGWEIPTRQIDPDSAMDLAQTANMSRDQFAPMEEARIYADRLAAGHSIEAMARSSHRTATHVRRSLQLLDLCRDIQEAIGQPHGINMMTAQILAVEFNRLGIGKDQQRDLWHKALKNAGLTAELAKRFMKAIARRIAKAQVTSDALFDLPANAAAIIHDARREFHAIQQARYGINKLIEANAEGVLDEILPGLAQWLRDNANSALKMLNKRFTEDAAALAKRTRQAG